MPYPLLVWFSVVYLGEHYVIDVIAGVAYAQMVFLVVYKFSKIKKFVLGKYKKYRRVKWRLPLTEICVSAQVTCTVVAPKTFYLDDELKAVVKDPEGDNKDTIIEAAKVCPVFSIILEEDWKQIYP